ncbi:hypothetical protein [Sphingobium sp. CFD-1]|uniref:hypothetical protein n=1 Tax=Sphingobium sp. CFD-1 TaxID=2878545 RepID=UPI00214C457F|nr:hypothetical protein [Sphingobium sp. CFD-1]
MKILVICAIAGMAISGVAEARGSNSVRGHIRSNGVYVAPHVRTNPNSTKLDNWSTRGNVNPYNGRTGTVDPYRPSSSNPYGSPYNNRRSSPY